MALLSAYSFDEGSGLVAADSGGGGYDLDAENSSTSWDASGHTGAGARKEHTGLVGPNTSYNAFTVMCWVKRTGTWSGWAAAFGEAAPAFLLEFRDSPELYAVNWFGGITSTDGTTTLTLDTWVHIALTRRSDGISKVIVNGTEENSGSSATAMNFGAGTWFAAGGTVSTGLAGEDADFNGIVDDLRVFDADLTEAEITTWMNTPVGATGTPIAWIAA